MRIEDKQLDGLELERVAEKRQRQMAEEEASKEDAEESMLATEVSRDLDKDRRDLVLRSIEGILAGDQVVVEMLPLPERDLRALDGLQAAVTGKDAKLSMFVFARDRREMLEQALAVLQPTLLAEAQMKGAYERIVAKVGEWREKLGDKEDAQDDLIVQKPRGEVGIVESDSDDVPDGESTLGTHEDPDVVVPPPSKSTLGHE